MKPLFTSFEELKPPTWSVFHKTGREKKREIKIIKEPDSSVNALLERETRLTELHSEICNSEQSDTKPAENDIDSLWKELQELGSLPAKHKDEDTKEVTQHLQNNPMRCTSWLYIHDAGQPPTMMKDQLEHKVQTILSRMDALQHQKYPTY